RPGRDSVSGDEDVDRSGEATGRRIVAAQRCGASDGQVRTIGRAPDADVDAAAIAAFGGDRTGDIQVAGGIDGQIATERVGSTEQRDLTSQVRRRRRDVDVAGELLPR